MRAVSARRTGKVDGWTRWAVSGGAGLVVMGHLLQLLHHSPPTVGTYSAPTTPLIQRVG
jgi:hypothetical protein